MRTFHDDARGVTAPAAATPCGPDVLAARFAGLANPLGGPALQPFHASLEPPRSYKIEGHLEGRLVVDIAPTEMRIHPGLPPLPAWGYGLAGKVTSPGPLLEVPAGRPLRIRFRNRLTGGLPFLTSLVAGDDDADSTQNHAGVAGGAAQDTSMSPIGWTVTHLHGGHVGPDSDGWPDHMVSSGGHQDCEYPNDYDNADLGLAKVGAALWYHDHAMDATRYHVYAGLAGGYLVRDRHEAELGLPTSAREGEVVLLLQDRNIGLDPQGRVRLLHKITEATAEFFGPMTLVNGRLWPRMPVRHSVVRLRLYNGSNARAYRLHLLDQSGTDLHNRVLVIGTEAGLMHTAVPLPADGALTMAPAERLDVLVDLSGLAGRRVYLVNSADAPFGDQPIPADVVAARPEARLAYPQVMRLDVVGERRDSRGIAAWHALAAGAVLNPSFRRLVHAAGPAPSVPEFVLPPDHGHRLILLSESDPPGHLLLTECRPDPAGSIEVQLPHETAPQRYAAAGSGFYDETWLRPKLGDWEVWRFLNTTGDTHPIHVHQSTFQVVGSAGVPYVTQATDAAGNQVPCYGHDTRATVAPLLPDGAGLGREYEGCEALGWKDTIRVAPGELVSLAIRFDRLGRYVYHCHVIEHEDQAMMRPFVVTPFGGQDHGHHH